MNIMFLQVDLIPPVKGGCLEVSLASSHSIEAKPSTKGMQSHSQSLTILEIVPRTPFWCYEIQVLPVGSPVS